MDDLNLFFRFIVTSKYQKNPTFYHLYAVGFASCKKDIAGAPSNTITATIDGVEESFNNGAYAQLTDGVTTNSNIAIFGANGTGTNADSMTLMVTGNQTIYATGTLHETVMQIPHL